MSIRSKMIEGKFFVTIRARMDRAVGELSRNIAYGNCPVKNDKIIFMTYKNAYECNPKYIAEEIIRQKLPYDLVWVIPKNGRIDITQFPPELRLVKRESYEFYEELGSAHIWIDNSLNCLWMSMPKKETQVYIETWHGSMGLKRVGKDDVQDPRWLQAANRVTEAADYCISDSTFENMVYRETHWPDTEILEYGHPRNDLLCTLTKDQEAALREKVADEYETIEPDDKLILYAPTFRDSGTLNNYDVDFERLLDTCEEYFGGNWKLLMRLHFHDRSKAKYFVKNSERIIDATDYLDMQELLAVADIGLTDYSSWCCDYALTGKPCFIYATDLEDYDDERGLYYPLEETPFPIATNNDELCENIQNFDFDTYEAKRQAFLKARGSWEDGHASERVVEKMKEIIGETGNSDDQGEDGE